MTLQEDPDVIEGDEEEAMVDSKTASGETLLANYVTMVGHVIIM